MAEHDPLRAAGGAAGVEDAGEVGAGTHRIRNWFAPKQQRLVTFHSGRYIALVGVDQLQPGQGFGQRDTDRCKRLVDHQNVGAAIAHGVLVFNRAPTDVERHDHSACPCGGQIEFDIPVGVLRQDGDAVAGIGAERTQASRQPRHTLPDLAPIPPSVAKYRRKTVRIDLQRAPQSMGNVHFDLPLDRCFLRVLIAPLT